ncbi:hypothetical protein GTY65_06320 [Streptomyces sp. SID8379]|uniref:hypothetical protein n=1 Tax=unclassified Streptomyces TaxID=2593676 RepID=UPI0003A307C7|nr:MULTISPECIES: hypothetical protein [unclassified Streptomyces]MYW63694.1 hypothetical protein [Streptomyces sp. SID8379]
MTTKTDAQNEANEATKAKASDEAAEVTGATEPAGTTGAAKADVKKSEADVKKSDAGAEKSEVAVEDLTDDEIEAELAARAGQNAPSGPTGVGQGAAAIVSTALGFLSMSGSWLGTVVSARETLTGQLTLSTNSSAGVAAQVKEGYTDGWHAMAAVGGVFALVALIVGVVVLARPAFGTPGRPQATWIKSVAWAGVSLGVIGLLLAVAKYTDMIFGTPGLS